MELGQGRNFRGWEFDLAEFPLHFGLAESPWSKFVEKFS
jgi:hypothetical protein